MITTAEPILKKTSYQLGESSTDTSLKRLEFFFVAVKHTIDQHKWKWTIKNQTLPTVAGTQEYDLTNALIITGEDYNMENGISELYNGTVKLDPVLYQNRGNFSVSDRFYLTPDNKTIGFTKSVTATDNYSLWYYATLKEVTSATTTLNIAIPENMSIAIVSYIKHLVHEYKRQRTDARNCIIDFKEQISELILLDASSKIKGMKKNIPTVTAFAKVNRNYSY